MSYGNPTQKADRALCEIGDLATRLRRDLDLAASAVDVILAEVHDARGEVPDDPAVKRPDEAVPVAVPAAHRDLLRSMLRTCQLGVEEDLVVERLPLRRRWAEREHRAYARLLAALVDGAIEVDADVIEVVSKLIESTDAANEFEQAALEHQALCGLLDQLTEGLAR